MENDLVRIVNNMISNALSNTHTILISKVVEVNSESIDVQPVINRVVDNESIKLPVFKSVPPIFLQGGGSYEAFPISVGDYCLLLVNERSFDRWYAGQDEMEPIEQRMHDYSDCFALCGVNPLSSAINIPSEKIRRVGDTEIDGDLEIDGNLIVNGNITCTGNITMQNFTIGGSGGTTVEESFFTSHTHPLPGGGNTGVPNP